MVICGNRILQQSGVGISFARNLVSDLSGIRVPKPLVSVQDISSATLLKSTHCLYTQFQEVLRQGKRVLLLDTLRKLMRW